VLSDDVPAVIEGRSVSELAELDVASVVDVMVIVD
jgi:hypothetical protein